jgi:predicted SAM-dependent methyltransferase
VPDYLNLGCGSHYHPAWTNVDLQAVGQEVIGHDLRRPLPFQDASFDVVYHSHVLEHFGKIEGKNFLVECARVLRPKGVLRVAVPDLEQIVRHYLASLEKGLSGDVAAQRNYDWMMLELYDQTVRSRSGGMMKQYFHQQPLPNEEFVMKRVGAEGRQMLKRAQAGNGSPRQKKESRAPKVFNFKAYPARLRELGVRCLLGEKAEALEVGRFRLGGEIHQWMYDRFSLRRLMEEIGCRQIEQRDAKTSYIADWTRFNLDTEPDGTVYKPDSLFMEGVKP